MNRFRQLDMLRWVSDCTYEHFCTGL